MMSRIRGVDGCKGGWLSVSMDLRSGEIRGEIHEDAATLFRATVYGVTAIDIPIGLSPRGSRACEGEARAILGPRKNSVFPTPVRATLETTSYEAACEVSFAACGKRLTKQTHAILPKIRDVDQVLRESPDLLEHVFEVHPEVCFYFMNEQQPLSRSKKSGFGFLGRYRLVNESFPGAADHLRTALDHSTVADDDILDALAALWTARRIDSRTAVRLPRSREERDECGLPMQMLA